jgi:hypothetical protein
MADEHFSSSTPKKRRQGQRMNAKQRQDAQQAFLASYVQSANILTSCNEIGIDRSLIYYWQEHDEQFMLQFNRADAEANLMIEAEIKRRAIDGWDEPLVSAGKRVGTVRKYSDTLLIFLAKARMPKYREKQQLDINTNVKAVEIYKVRMPDNGRD